MIRIPQRHRQTERQTDDLSSHNRALHSIFFIIGELQSGALPNLPVPVSCLLPSRVDLRVQRLKVIIDCPQPDRSRATYRPPPLGRWSKCSGSDTVMFLLGNGTSKMSKETQPE